MTLITLAGQVIRYKTIAVLLKVFLYYRKFVNMNYCLLTIALSSECLTASIKHIIDASYPLKCGIFNYQHELAYNSQMILAVDLNIFIVATTSMQCNATTNI